MQHGEEYRALGPDAVLLCQHCGLNPAGNKHPPQASFRVDQLQQILKHLTAQGLSAVRLLPSKITSQESVKQEEGKLPGHTHSSNLSPKPTVGEGADDQTSALSSTKRGKWSG